MTDIPEHTGIAKVDTKNSLIAIGGGTAAGKTTIATDISNELGATVISMDDYYISPQPTSAENWDDPTAINWWELFTDLRCLVNLNESTEVPVFSFEKVERVGTREVEETDVVVVEGLWACSDRLAADPMPFDVDLSIYLEVDDDVRLMRRIRRDREERDQGVDETLEWWEENVRPMHREHVEPTKHNADIIISEWSALNAQAVAEML